MDIFFVILLSYTCGSIPFGLILTKIFINQDVRKVGSGNIGATNVLRTGNKFLAFTTLLLDILKGFVPVYISSQYLFELVHVSCLAAFLGHVFPIWLKFKGGKGVATYLGILFALSIELSFLFIFTWIAISLVFRYSSLSSMFASLTIFVVNSFREIAVPLIKGISNKDLYMDSLNNSSSFILFVFFILIIFTHRKNISNLKNKTEDKIKI